MLKALVGLLLLANIGFAAWSQGWLDGIVGARVRGDREPERLARQVRPETVVIVAPPSSSSSSSSLAAAAAVAGPAVAASATTATEPPACLEAGPYDALQVVAAIALLEKMEPPLPDGSWTDERTERPAGWLVYMGRYAGSGPLEKKEDELKRRNLEFEEVHLPGLEPGLSLGRFDDRAAADAALAGFARQGIRTARVVRSVEPTVSHRLRVERAEPVLASRLASLQGQAGIGNGFLPCGAAKAATSTN